MEFKERLRPCLVKGQKHIFHQWVNRSWALEHGTLGPHSPGGFCSVTMAIVEDENGQVHEAYPRDVRFIDDQAQRYFENYMKNIYSPGEPEKMEEQQNDKNT